MAYIALNNESNILLLDISTGKEIEAPIGELFLSFLELDLKEYDELYHFIYSTDFNYDDFESLCQTYPNTYKELIKQRDYIISCITRAQNRGEPTINSVEHILPEKDTKTEIIRDCAIHFLTENRDVFSPLYEHAFFSFSSFGNAFTSHEDLRIALDFHHFQEKFKKIVDFCFLNNDNQLSNLNKKERFFVFSAAETNNFESLLETQETIIPISLGLYRDIKKMAFNHFKNDFYSASDILPLLDDTVINKIKNTTKLAKVGLCFSIHDFLSFEFKEILTNDIDIKRCANCGKLFIPSGKYNTDCCDRIPKGQKYNCKKIMAQKRRKIKVDSNPIEREYQKAYKRMYARVNSGILEKSEFFRWSEEAKKKRDAASQKYAQLNNAAIVEEFKIFLNNK